MCVYDVIDVLLLLLLQSYNADGTISEQQPVKSGRRGRPSQANKRKNPVERKVSDEIIVNKDLPGFEGNEIRRYYTVASIFMTSYYNWL